MPRANRHSRIEVGRNYHVTHRCHDRAFLLKFARDRDAYRGWLREGLKRFKVRCLSYCITSNHVHLLLNTASREELSGLMQYVEGAMAQMYNVRKRRQGAFWSDRYHATLIDGGTHLWACLRYIDLNMVRAGVVRHPEQWAWTGWGELTGLRRRNRAIDMPALLAALGGVSREEFLANYRVSIAQSLAAVSLAKEPHWAESVAVGDPSFVDQVRAELLRDYTRRRFSIEKPSPTRMVLHETAAPYGAQKKPRNRPLAPFHRHQNQLTT